MLAHHVERVRDPLGEDVGRAQLGCLELVVVGWRSGSKSSTYRPSGVRGGSAAGPCTSRAGRRRGTGAARSAARCRTPPARAGRRPVVERPPVDHRVRPHEHRHHAGQRGHPTDLGRDALDVFRLRAWEVPRPHRTDGPRPRTRGRSTSRCTRALAPRRSRRRARSGARGASSGTARRGRCGPGPCPGGGPWRSTPPDASPCSASPRGTRGRGPRRSRRRPRPPPCCSPGCGSPGRRATPRRPRRSRCARCGPGTPPARTPASRSGARGCARRSRRSAGRRQSPSALLPIDAKRVHHRAMPTSTRRRRASPSRKHGSAPPPPVHTPVPQIPATREESPIGRRADTECPELRSFCLEQRRTDPR